MSVSSESSNNEGKVNERGPYKEIPIILTIVTEVITDEDIGNTCICRNYIDQFSLEKKKNVFVENELIPQVKVNICERFVANPINIDEQNQQDRNVTKITQIKLKDLCNQLKKLGFPITGSIINIFVDKVNDYVHYGSDPIDGNIFLDSDQIDLDHIQIKIINYLDEKLVKNSHLGGYDVGKNEDEEEEESEDEKDHKEYIGRRTKERRIGYIVEKVHAWRKFYNGFYDVNGEFVRYSLEKAAKLVGISKKSLDDYLLQLRLGRKYGFDFNKNKNEKVGVLRVFVKDARANDSLDKKVKSHKKREKAEKIGQ